MALSNIPEFFYRTRKPASGIRKRYYGEDGSNEPYSGPEYAKEFGDDPAIRRCSNPHCRAILDVTRYVDDEEVECDFCGNREPINLDY